MREIINPSVSYKPELPIDNTNTNGKKVEVRDAMLNPTLRNSYKISKGLNSVETTEIPINVVRTIIVKTVPTSIVPYVRYIADRFGLRAEVLFPDPEDTAIQIFSTMGELVDGNAFWNEVDEIAEKKLINSWP